MRRESRLAGVRPRVLVVRGHQVNPWELRPWEELLDRYDVSYLRTRSARFDTSLLRLPARPARTVRDLLPGGRAGDLLARIPGDRYLTPARALQGADIVHSQELGYWYSAQAARLKRRLGYRLVLTVWETIPFGETYRNIRTRPYRKLVLSEADLFLAATERARAALLLEGAPPERIRVAPPGVDLERFAAPPAAGDGRHLILSPGRLVWEKGHQDAIRALAALRSGLVECPDGADPRLLVVGAGPEEERLRRYAGELGLAGAVELRRFVPYEEMPALFASASCMVLGSLPGMHWEEQFGMVLAEAMAASVPILASSSGAIPEVVGAGVPQFAPGDWLGLARLLAAGPLSRPPGERAAHDPERVSRFGAAAAGARLGALYDELLGNRPPGP
jgi:glycosyltransferase involved in cell wall biosynthesis